MSTQCIAVIADIVGSRQMDEPGERSELQEALRRFIETLNLRYSPAILARFAITTGDEFQGLLKSATALADLLTDLDLEFPVTVRVGIGLGTLSTRLEPIAIGMDGSVWHMAREAIVLAKRDNRLGGVFQGFGAENSALNGVARLLMHFRHSLVPSQRQTLSRLREGRPQSSLVGELAHSKQAVHERVKSVHWDEYREGEEAFRAMLAHHDYSSDWKSQ